MADQAASLDRFRHTALLHEDPGEFSAGVLDFVRAGVQAHEPVLVAGAGPGLRVLRAQLGGEDERVSWADLAGRGPGPGGVVGLMRSFALGYAGRPVRCVQEVAWPGRPPGDVADTLRQEALINQVFARVPATILCAYDVRATARVLDDAERAHPSLIRSGQPQLSRCFAGIDGDLPLSRPPPAAIVHRFREDQAGVRRAAAEYARDSGLGEDRVQDVVLAVGELAGNTLKHTTGPGTLTMWTAAGELLVQIDDSGHLRGALPGARLEAPGPPGGQGLWLVHQLCDLVDIRSGPGGTSIRIHIRLPS